MLLHQSLKNDLLKNKYSGEKNQAGNYKHLQKVRKLNEYSGENTYIQENLTAGLPYILCK